MILLVEDNEDDVFLFQRALQKADLDARMQVVRDGEEAIAYLSGTGKFGNRTAYPLPTCIFLDLKLPFVNGFEVLDWMRQQPALKNIDVIILTSSGEERDQRRADALGARGYLVKPPTAEMLLQMGEIFPACSPAKVDTTK